MRFHPTKELFVCTAKIKDEARLELYRCALSDDESKWTFKLIPLQGRRMNFASGCAYQFNGDELIVSAVPTNHPLHPPAEPVTTGPAIQTVERNARKAPGRTYQDLLKNEYDEDKLRYYLSVELIVVDVVAFDGCSDNDNSIKVIPQSIGGAMIPQNPSRPILYSAQPSPSRRYLLVTSLTAFSYSVPLGKFGKVVEIWDMQSDIVIPVASLPVDDEVPLSYDACSRHPRAFRWHPLEDAVMYVRASDGGDNTVDVGEDGERDAVYVRTLVADDGEATLRDAIKLVGLQWRFSDLSYMSSRMAILEEYRWKDRMERRWVLDKDGTKIKMLWERCWQDRYGAPGEPLRRRMGENGTYFIVQPTETSIFLRGAGASPLGDRPFLDVCDFSGETITTERLWRCTAPVDGELDAEKEVGGVLPKERNDIYESFVCLMGDNDSMLISRESKTTPRNYYLTKLSNLHYENQVTSFQHPQPDLLGVTKELVQYKREDGVDLTCKMYLPANYDGTPRPTVSTYSAFCTDFDKLRNESQDPTHSSYIMRISYFGLTLENSRTLKQLVRCRARSILSFTLDGLLQFIGPLGGGL